MFLWLKPFIGELLFAFDEVVLRLVRKENHFNRSAHSAWDPSKIPSVVAERRVPLYRSAEEAAAKSAMENLMFQVRVLIDKLYLL